MHWEMENQNLNQLIKNLWEKVFVKSGEYLFTVNYEDRWLYFLDSGKIILESNNKKIISLWEGEVLGEKSFLENKKKPIDAKALDDSILYKIDKDDFDKYDFQIKEQILTSISIFLSSRVYKLNNILDILNFFNEKLLEKTPFTKENDFLKPFEQMIDVESYVVLRHNWDCLEKLYSNILFDEELEDFVLQNYNQNTNQKIGNNYIFVCSWWYIFLLFGTIKLQDYVITNSVMYMNSMFKYMWENLEAMKNKRILDDI